jgi:hypothetical protein
MTSRVPQEPLRLVGSGQGDPRIKVLFTQDQQRKSGGGERQQHYTADWISWSAAVVESEMLRGLERSESAWVRFLLRLDG